MVLLPDSPNIGYVTAKVNVIQLKHLGHATQRQLMGACSKKIQLNGTVPPFRLGQDQQYQSLSFGRRIDSGYARQPPLFTFIRPSRRVVGRNVVGIANHFSVYQALRPPQDEQIEVAARDAENPARSGVTRDGFTDLLIV